MIGIDRAKAANADGPEQAEMRRLLHEAMDHGACGWSVQRMSAEINFQRDYDGTPMATDVMHDETAIELAEVLGERNAGFMQMTIARSVTDPTIDWRHTELLASVGGRPVIWNALSAMAAAGLAHRNVITWLDSCIARGLRVYAQASTTEVPMFFTFEDWNLWDDRSRGATPRSDRWRSGWPNWPTRFGERRCGRLRPWPARPARSKMSC